ncbi:MAG TPA: TonB-dependent receptor [Steroidobacteraceae bacterium]|jgi:outer membrane receptor protein involved in Fe transport|nr:TonB-dependent receptor [Steroidobacteraceae bacterium]
MNTQTTTRIVARSAWRILILVSAIVLVTASPREVAAQSSTATLRGKAPASSQITATNTETGLTRRVQTSSDGVYVLVALPPGTYKVDAGPGTERVVTLAVASTATLDLEAKQENVAEVVVTGTRLAEVKTSEVGSGISLHQIETVPQITRNFLEFADAVPGMQFEVDAKGNTSIRSGTLSTATTNVYIDGIGQKNYVRPSGLTGQGGADPLQDTRGDPGNPFPQLAIGEYKVITSNYKAEYDQVSGAAITAVTKSGTNEFESQAFMTYTEAGFRAETPAEKAAGTGKEGGNSKEYGFSVGGPIIKDAMHFFFTYEAKEFSTPNTIRAPQLFDDSNQELDWVGGLPADLQANYGPVANPFDEDLFFGKIDWEFSEADRLELSSKIRRERQQAGAAGIVAESAASTYVNDDKRWQLSWEHSADRWFNEVTAAFEDTTDSPSKTSDAPGRQFVALGTRAAGFDPILQVDGVDPRSYFFSAQRGYSLQDDLTFSNFSWHGDHTVKTGIKFKDIKLEHRDAGTTPFYSFYVSPTPAGAGVEADPFQVTFGAQVGSNAPTTSTSKNRQYGFYLQDDWAVNDKLTLNLGVRYDYEQTPNYTDFVTPQRFVDALNAIDTNGCADQTDPACPFFFSGGYHGAQPGQTYAQTLAIGGININDYISNGHNRKDQSDQIAPRFGFSYDLNADQQHVIFGGAGRSYDRNVFSILQHETNKATLYVPTIQFWNANNAGCLPGTTGNPFCIEWNDSYLTQAGLASIAPAQFGEMHLINNNLKTPYSDQFSLGMRNALGNWNTSATVAYITSYDGVIASSGNRFGDGTWYWYDSFAYAVDSAQVPNVGSGLFLFDNAKATRTTQLLLSADKPYTSESGWSASFAYTYSRAKERMQFNGDYQFDYAFPYYSPYVLSARVPKHRLVALGSYDAPWGINLGAKMVVETPKPLTAFDGIGTDPPNGLNYNFLKVSQHPEDTIGYFSLDLQVTKTFEFFGDSAVQIRVDLLNATNRKNFATLFDGFPGKPFYFQGGDLQGVPRTVRLSFNVGF